MDPVNTNPEINLEDFSKTHRAMLEMLSDGQPHYRGELHKCCGPSCVKMVRYHISRIRKQLRPVGQDIVCELVNRQIHYRHVRLLASPNDGRR